MAEQVEVRRGREGSRWVNERPSAEEVAAWFATVPMHEGMDHQRYVGGVTLIPAKEKGDEIVGYRDDGAPILAERTNQTFTPYVKVETRLSYWWDYLAAHEDWVGVIEPVEAKTPELGLPAGYFKYAAAKPGGDVVSFVGCSMRVRIVEKAGHTWQRIDGVDGRPRQVLQGVPVLEGLGTKIVPTATRWDADVNALMKAETGAIGRALGMAGMLVIPGSGVATAEDMQEALASTGAGAVSPEAAEAAAVAAAADAALPDDSTQAQPAAAPARRRQRPATDADPAPASDEELRKRAGEILAALEADHPKALGAFRTWARGRGFESLSALTSPALKGVVKKLEKTLDQAQASAPAEHVLDDDGEQPTVEMAAVDPEARP